MNSPEFALTLRRWHHARRWKGLARRFSWRVGTEAPKKNGELEAPMLNEILRNAPKAVDMDLVHQREALASTLRI